MSFKPPVMISQQAVMEQVNELKKQKQHLELMLEQAKYKQQTIEASIGENDQLREQVKLLMKESFELFAEEAKRRSTYYPDIHFKILTAALDKFTPKVR
jgi:hypothetical protein